MKKKFLILLSIIILNLLSGCEILSSLGVETTNTTSSTTSTTISTNTIFTFSTTESTTTSSTSKSTNTTNSTTQSTTSNTTNNTTSITSSSSSNLSNAAILYYQSKSFNYDQVITKQKSEVKSIVYSVISEANIFYNYVSTRDYFNQTDINPKTGKVVLLYTQIEIDQFETQSGKYNREHVWPQSLGEDKDQPGGHDLHHVRPCLETLNSARGNLKYGNAKSSGSAVKYNNIIYGYKTSTTFEPLDNVKGDIARICMYYSIKYQYDLSVVFDISYSEILNWNKIDPVSDIEIYRNDVIEGIQGNRNIFIDYPNIADYIWG